MVRKRGRAPGKGPGDGSPSVRDAGDGRQRSGAADALVPNVGAPARTRLLLLVLLVALACVPFVANLGDQSLWQDEAQTALLARSVLEHGKPLGTDGRNFFSQELGAEYGPGYIWRWHTWLPFYVLAGAFAVLGESTFSARLPFALFGIATVVAAYFFAKTLWKSHRAGLIAGLLLTGSVPFLILSRQCRYYSLAAFFSVVGLYAYVRLIEKHRSAPWVYLAASVCLFHTHYVYWAALVATVLVDMALLHREAWRRTALYTGIAAALNLPWIVWLSGMSYGDRYGETVLSLAQVERFAPSFAWQFVRYGVTPTVFVVLAVLALWRLPRGSRAGRGSSGSRRRDLGVERADPPHPRARAPVEVAVWKRAVLPLLFIAANIAVLSLTAPAPFFRYLAPLLPLGSVLAAGTVEAAMNRRFWLGLAALGGFLAFQPLPEFAYEITHDFRGPVDGIVRYLNEHAKADDVVAITYSDLPLKFYTGLRVVGGLTGEDLAPAKNADWIIVRKHVISEKDYAVRQYLAQNILWPQYRRIEIDYPDTPFQNRESPQDHLYRTATDADRVIIFQRIASPQTLRTGPPDRPGQFDPPDPTRPPQTGP